MNELNDMLAQIMPSTPHYQQIDPGTTVVAAAVVVDATA